MAEQKGCEEPAFLCCSFATSEIASMPELLPTFLRRQQCESVGGRANSGVKSQRRQEGREVSKQKVGSERRKMFYFFKMKESLVTWLIGPEKR